MTYQGLEVIRTTDPIAYFSMEMALDSEMPTYAGGLGVLAGDTLRAAADLGVPMVGVTLLHRKGYFRQRLDVKGRQREEPADWDPNGKLEELPHRVAIRIEGRPVHVRSWRYSVYGTGGILPVYLLDTAVPENSAWDQTLTDHLYGGDERYRLAQEAVLGLGGLLMLRALGYERAAAYHMNEGHSSLLTLALLRELSGDRGMSNAGPSDREAVRQQCVFTTHTPVPAGHDRFPMPLVRAVIGDDFADAVIANECCPEGVLNTTYLALFFSRYINGVSLRHEEVSRTMFPAYPINSVTNGVHAVTWTSPPFERVFDRHLPEWRRDNRYLRYVIHVALGEILQAHAEAKQELLSSVERRTGRHLGAAVMTIGIARRATGYKRLDLLFSDTERLRRITRDVGPIQVVCAGKAHPNDESGKAVIRWIFEVSEQLGDDVPVVYLEEYDMELAKLLCAGCDLWLNTPQRPHEASGTSGMKAALNGVPSLSVLDGWWMEGWIEGVTGWAIREDGPDSGPASEAASMYAKLAYVVLPLFYHRPMAYADVMRSAIALNGSYFDTQRMVDQYVRNAYQSIKRPEEEQER